MFSSIFNLDMALGLGEMFCSVDAEKSGLSYDIKFILIGGK